MLIVVKFGGSLLGEGISPSISEDIESLLARNRVILVHGGGERVTEIAGRLGKRQVFVVSPGGIRSRYTDKETAEIYVMVMAGVVNKEIVAALQRKGLPAMGLSGVDGGLIRAERKRRLIIMDGRGRRRAVEGGYTGKIVGVNKGLLGVLLDKGYLPVVAPIALGRGGELLNVDGDRAAAYIAGEVRADTVVFLTDVPGILIDGQLQAMLTTKDLEKLIPKIGFGMKTKVLASTEALEMGAMKAVILSGMTDRPITAAIRGSCGTTITRSWRKIALREDQAAR